MKIALLTTGVLPVPAVRGGAVENLIDFCLDYNNKYHIHDITIYSISDPLVKNHLALHSEVNHYYYIDVDSPIAKIRKQIYKYFKRKNNYYHYSIEYFFEQALTHIRNQLYDIIIIENRPSFILKLKNITNAKIIIHQENDYLNSQSIRHLEIYHSASCIINTSNYITKRVRTIAPNDTKCKTVYNGIDTEHFFCSQAKSRKNVGLSDTDFVIVYSGRLTKEKGILQLIQAISKLKTIKNLKLLVIGASFYGSGQTPDSFYRLLEEESKTIRDRVVFTGYIDYNYIPSFLKIADIAVVPSMWEEAFGLTVVEAMAAGLPLITTRSGGIPEICEGVATIVDRKQIVNNLAEAIYDLYIHPDKRKMMTDKGLLRSRKFDKNCYARQYFDALTA